MADASVLARHFVCSDLYEDVAGVIVAYCTWWDADYFMGVRARVSQVVRNYAATNCNGVCATKSVVFVGCGFLFCRCV